MKKVLRKRPRSHPDIRIKEQLSVGVYHVSQNLIKLYLPHDERHIYNSNSRITILNSETREAIAVSNLIHELEHYHQLMYVTTDEDYRCYKRSENIPHDNQLLERLAEEIVEERIKVPDGEENE
jgi:hypothetical protein